MTAPWDDDLIEVERYELDEAPAYSFAWQRRDFLKVLGGGVLVGLIAPPLAATERETDGPAWQDRDDKIDAWLHIDQKGAVTVYTGKVEVGQGIRTSLSQAVADELHVAVAAVTLVMGDTDRVPYDRGTFGSQTTPRMAPQLRKAAAAARAMLAGLAAQQLGAEPEELTVRAGAVWRGDRSVAFGELTKGAALSQAIGAETAIQPATEWTVAGKSVARVDTVDKVTGAHRYAADIVRPGMLFGAMLRPPTIHGRLVSIDTTWVEAQEALTLVRDDGFVGVVAPDEHAAREALVELKAQWAPGENEPSDADLFEVLQQPVGGGRGGGGRRRTGNLEQGDIDQGMAAADHRLEATFTIPYIAHAPLEPRAAVAEWDPSGKLTVWTGTQRPFGVLEELIGAFRLEREMVRVLVPDTGSGYGGKHTGEAALEAARLSKAVGKPVKVRWSRREEFTWAYFRPAGVIRVASGVTNDGSITAWEFHNHNSGGSAIRPLYEIENQRVQYHRANSPLRQGAYRGLASTANVFARESHIDELAHQIGMDPLEFRLKNVNDPRLEAVFEAAAGKFDWDASREEGIGIGIGGGFEKGGYVATCAEVTKSRRNKIMVRRLVTAFECGAIVHPDNLESQVEGAVIMGLGGALFEGMKFVDGRITNANFTRYKVPHFEDVPPMETVLLDRKDLPSAGAGETPITGVAPAIANAWFMATGQRLRSLPLTPA